MTEYEFFDIANHPISKVLGAIALAFIVYLLNISLIQRKRFISSLDRISANFRTDLERLGNEKIRVIHTLNDQRFKEHESIISSELNKLPFFIRFRINRAWKKLAYGKNKKEGEYLLYAQYADYKSISENEKVRKLAKHRIHSIIKLCK